MQNLFEVTNSAMNLPYACLVDISNCNSCYNKDAEMQKQSNSFPATA